VLITGSGDHFLPDVDYEELQRLTEPEPIVGDPLAWYRVTSALEALPQPTVAAIDGEAAGGGCLLALACTFRLASERAAIGSVALDMGVLGTESPSHLVPLVGPAVAADLLMTSRHLKPSEAKQLGLLNEVLPTADFSEHVREWCRRMAEQPPGLMQAIKHAVIQEAGSSRDEHGALDGQELPKPALGGGCGCRKSPLPTSADRVARRSPL
jgi:enoyl-CoA hydratase/carnithine racemase